MNENCDVDVAIDRAGYQSWKRQQTTTLQVFFVLFTRPASPSGIYGSLPLPLVLLTTTRKRKHYSRVIRGYSRFFAWNCGLYWSAERFHACAKCDLARSRFNLFTKLISQKRIRWPYFFNAKTYSTARAECMCEIKKKTAEWKFLNLEISIFFNFSKIYSAEFFLIFLVSSSVCNKKIFIKKIWGHRLSF